MQFDCNPAEPVWAGIDVSQSSVDFFVLNRKENPRGRRRRRGDELAAMAAELLAAGVTHVAVEATGGYERLVWTALEEAGMAVAVVQPRRVRHFARAFGVEAKTDSIDREMLALFGERVQPAPTPLPSAKRSRYRELGRQRAYVVELRAEVRRRRHHAEHAETEASNERVMELLSNEIELLEQQLQAALEQMPEVAQLVQRLEQAAGVGCKTAWVLTAELPELGKLTGKQVAALAGLAPRARDSGAHSGKRSIGGGRQRVRTAMYLAARAAVRVDRRLRDLYERLQAKGKEKQAGLIAVARHLLVMLNAMVRDGSNWQPAPIT